MKFRKPHPLVSSRAFATVQSEPLLTKHCKDATFASYYHLALPFGMANQWFGQTHTMPPINAPTWKLLVKKAASDAEFAGPAFDSQLVAVEQGLGIQLPQDLRELMAFGISYSVRTVTFSACSNAASSTSMNSLTLIGLVR